jgi:hypothetical protein
MLPMLIQVKVRDEARSFGFYLPMLLVYLLFLPILALGAIAFLILLAIPQTSRQAQEYLALVWALPSLLSASVGTEVIVQSDTKDVVVRIT